MEIIVASAATSPAVERPDGIYKAGRWLCIAGFVLWPFFFFYLISGLSGQPWETIFQRVVLHTMLLCAAGACFFRGASNKGDRAIWFAFGFGSLMEAFGIFWSTYVLYWDETPPFPSVQDFFYLMVYPGWYTGMILLARKHLRDQRLSLWLHGVIGGLAIAALAAALVFDTIVSTEGANAAVVGVSLAYPVADTMLVALLVCVIALTGWRPGLSWGLIAAGVGLFYMADIIYALGIANGTYQITDTVDAFWPAGMLLIALAGYVKAKPAEKFRHDTAWMLIPTVIFGCIAIGLLVYDWKHEVNAVAFWLALSAIVVIMVQFVLALLENASLLSTSRDEALTDDLTGLGNRRKLFADLAILCKECDAENPGWFLMLDLNGFKNYNDKFGHIAGDGLLNRLGARLNEVVSPFGCVAYRFGGDEFCVLGKVASADPDAVTAVALVGLTETGEGFETSSAYGVSQIPADATEPDDLVRVADQRMYAQKHESGPLDERHLETVIRVIQRFAPIVDTHRFELLSIVKATALAVGLTGLESERAITAFEVRDIGYYAVPSEMLRKPEPLNPAEWALMKTHTIVGERLLRLSPSLVNIATIVRSSHERPDGAGYPDGLSGDATPMAARVVSVVAAFDALISQRPYRETATVEAALAEIRRNAGTQFDPVVVDAFCREVERVGFVAGRGSASHTTPRASTSN
ncbi:MAG: diguanylate cyclase [Thermoleophilaceae bacterium]|nr:diguanylate cyclase [Thermoleophilaceae bacterium]